MPANRQNDEETPKAVSMKNGDNDVETISHIGEASRILLFL